MPKRAHATEGLEEGKLHPAKRLRASQASPEAVVEANSSQFTGTETVTSSATAGERPSITTVISWNAETSAPFLDTHPRKLASYGITSSATKGDKPNVLRQLITRHHFPDFVCLQEVRGRHGDTEWIAALAAAANGAEGPKYKAYTSLNRATRGARHFGVVTFAKDPSQVAVAREVEWDVEGRVMVLEMHDGWALINVYALNGSEYPWVDQSAPNKPTGKTRNQRKREFNKLLLEEVKQMQARGLRVVLIGDFNISLTKRDCYPRLRTEYPHALARKEFNEVVIPQAGVVDIFREVHGDKKGFSWFAKGKPQGTDCARVDYALVDRSLVDNVAEIAYLEDQEERAHSDHAPILLKLRDMDKIEQLD
ncbi:DNase I-like protein [Heliocybe sulcata]|uniref:DNase I-like protein n=1 Tax=Heliocybe sulcata TaxID=5364 RepID=A0A5C3NG25_9AGAM|nr:DNase I-like protein [Heliocybe sulcata]